MPLDRLRIKALRCLIEAELELDAERNYIYGANGAGKTSLLEAMFVLGRGRSFRTRQIRKLVRRGEAGFTVYGEVTTATTRHRIGVAYVRGRLEKKVDGEVTAGSARLAELLPVQVIDPSLHELIQGGPSGRRRFLDWGVFHVEPSYLEAWKRYRRQLSQRNAALKAPASRREITAWTNGLVDAGETVHRYRADYVRNLVNPLLRYGQALLGGVLTVDYLPGWRDEQPLGEALSRSEERDRFSGTTEVGPHRADLAIRFDGVFVAAEASRGQQKLAAIALVLAQTELHAAKRGKPLLLVDDPAAELDHASLERLLGVLAHVPAQLVLTGLTTSQLAPRQGFPVFHVERGLLKAV